MRLLKSSETAMKTPLTISFAPPACLRVGVIGRFKVRAAGAAVSCCLVLACALTGAAQGRARDVLPRVGTIRDQEPATQAIQGGCDNHFLRLAGETEFDKNIFISTADGRLAWMNLDGRDTRLEPVLTILRHRGFGEALARHDYRAGRTLVTVTYTQLSDYVFEYPAKIVIRRGRAARTIRATGLPQCD